MLPWTDFIAKHPQAHVLIGRTREIAQWRRAALRLIRTQGVSGEISLRQDPDDEQGHYLILVGLELEADAARLAQLLGAKRVDGYGGYSSVFEFDPALLRLAARPKSRVRAISGRRPSSRVPE